MGGNEPWTCILKAWHQLWCCQSLASNKPLKETELRFHIPAKDVIAFVAVIRQGALSTSYNHPPVQLILSLSQMSLKCPRHCLQQSQSHRITTSDSVLPWRPHRILGGEPKSFAKKKKKKASLSTEWPITKSKQRSVYSLYVEFLWSFVWVDTS